MHTQFYKVLSQSETVTITKQDGTQTQKSTIVLQEFGGKYENQYIAVMLGQIADLRFYPGDLVVASLRFQTREYNGSTFQDITIQDIRKLS